MPALVDLNTFELFARSVEELGDAGLRECVRAIKHFVPQMSFPKRFDDTECVRALADSGYFPPVAVRLIASGERSGQLERMLDEAAGHQAKELERWLAVLTAVLGPAVILLVGAMVLFIVLAILLPIFNMNQMVK